MSLMVKSRSARRKSKHCSTHSIISRLETRTTETSSCKALKVLTWSASKSWKTSAEPLVRPSSENAEIYNNCSLISKLHPVNSMRSELRGMILTVIIMKLVKIDRDLLRRHKMLTRNFREPNNPRTLRRTMCAQ